MSIRNLRLEDVFMRKDGNVTGAVITHKYAKRIAGLSAVFQLLIRRADHTAQETSVNTLTLGLPEVQNCAVRPGVPEVQNCA